MRYVKHVQELAERGLTLNPGEFTKTVGHKYIYHNLNNGGYELYHYDTRIAWFEQDKEYPRKYNLHLDVYSKTDCDAIMNFLAVFVKDFHFADEVLMYKDNGFNNKVTHGWNNYYDAPWIKDFLVTYGPVNGAKVTTNNGVATKVAYI